MEVAFMFCADLDVHKKIIVACVRLSSPEGHQQTQERTTPMNFLRKLLGAKEARSSRNATPSMPTTHRQEEKPAQPPSVQGSQSLLQANINTRKEISEISSKAMLYAFFIRTGSMFAEVISTSSSESWINKVREEARMPDAAVVLIEPEHWNAPKVTSPTPDSLRSAWPLVKTGAQEALASRGIPQAAVEVITQRPVAITANPVSGLVTFVFAHTA